MTFEATEILVFSFLIKKSIDLKYIYNYCYFNELLNNLINKLFKIRVFIKKVRFLEIIDLESAILD